MTHNDGVDGRRCGLIHPGKSPGDLCKLMHVDPKIDWFTIAQNNTAPCMTRCDNGILPCYIQCQVCALGKT